MKQSAGILLHRGGEVLLVHPGGPFWAKRDDGAWSIPKGEYEDGEQPLSAALREFEEEIGSALEHVGELIELGDLLGCKYWGPRRFAHALKAGVEQGRFRRVSRGRYGPSR